MVEKKENSELNKNLLKSIFNTEEKEIQQQPNYIFNTNFNYDGNKIMNKSESGTKKELMAENVERMELRRTQSLTSRIEDFSFRPMLNINSKKLLNQSKVPKDFHERLNYYEKLKKEKTMLNEFLNVNILIKK